MNMKNIYCLIAAISISLVSSAQGMWTQKANLGGVARHGAAGFSIGTKGYIGTGYNGTGNGSVDFWEWDQATNVWTQKANFGGALRYFATGFSIGSKGYIVCGRGNAPIGNGAQDLWEYDPTANSWVQKANFPGAPRFLVAAFSIG